MRALDCTRPTAVALAILVLVMFPITAHGQALDRASTDALAATLRMLADPAARAQAIGATPGAAEADRQVQSLAGSPELVQEMYAVAAAALEDLVRSTGGDAARMGEVLERAKTDPAVLARSLSPDTVRRLRELSAKLPNTTTPGRPTRPKRRDGRVRLREHLLRARAVTCPRT